MARPKGYADWAPKEETLALVAAVSAILREYEAHLPLTVRQIFYRLVGAYSYDKTEQAYARLCEHLVRARRAQMIPFDAIRDDGTVELVPQTFNGPADFWAGVRDDLKHYSRNRQVGQAQRIELWCEAAGMAPQLQRVAFPYSIPVYSTGGFSSVTVTHEIAQRALDVEAPTVFLHVGDYDPSGESIFEAMAQDVGAFIVKSIGGKWNSATGETLELHDDRECLFKPERVAVTEEQVDEYELDTAPPKKSDTRSRNWGGVETCQAEAMPPDVLADVVRAAIEAHFDLDRYEREVALEADDRRQIGALLDAAGP